MALTEEDRERERLCAAHDEKARNYFMVMAVVLSCISLIMSILSYCAVKDLRILIGG